MIDKQKQIDYWMMNAEEDVQTAGLLISQKRILHGLFFCHLTIEKIIKAHFVKVNNEIAPKSHNLIYLSEKSNLIFDDDTNIFLGILMKYQLEGRYPDYNPKIPSIQVVEEYLKKTKELLLWLKMKL